MVDKFNVSLGQKLRAARRQRGWSLGEVEAHTTGEFKASVVGAYERGERAVSVQRFVRLADVYGVVAADLLPVPIPGDELLIDLDALALEGSNDIAERYLAAIQLLRREPGNMAIRRSDQAILNFLLQPVESATTD